MSGMSFGEINIPSSRAFWDDCDEDEEEPVDRPFEKLELSFEDGEMDKPFASELMLLVEGPNISEFAEKTLLKDATKICSIPAKKSSLYHIAAKNTLLAILDEELTLSGEVTELLLPYAKLAERIITLSIKPKVEFKSENIKAVRDEITFLRSINSQVKHIKELKTPNFIAGVTAGIACWRENEKMPASSYIAYTDNVAMDTMAALPIIKLLQDDLGFDCADSYTPKLKDDSHLYS